MEASGLDLKPLGELARIRLPNRFERVWAKDKDYGTPYLNATDLLSLHTLGKPAKERYLSRVSQVDFDALIVRENMLLITCSGTIGRVYHVPRRLDGWVATHDLVRVIADVDMSGYLYAWCLSPAAQVQMLSPVHGAQIDHIAEEHMREIMVPMLPDSQMRAINAEVLGAIQTREASLAAIQQAANGFDR